MRRVCLNRAHIINFITAFFQKTLDINHCHATALFRGLVQRPTDGLTATLTHVIFVGLEPRGTELNNSLLQAHYFHLQDSLT